MLLLPRAAEILAKHPIHVASFCIFITTKPHRNDECIEILEPVLYSPSCYTHHLCATKSLKMHGRSSMSLSPNQKVFHFTPSNSGFPPLSTSLPLCSPTHGQDQDPSSCWRHFQIPTNGIFGRDRRTAIGSTEGQPVYQSQQAQLRVSERFRVGV